MLTCGVHVLHYTLTNLNKWCTFQYYVSPSDLVLNGKAIELVLKRRRSEGDFDNSVRTPKLFLPRSMPKKL